MLLFINVLTIMSSINTHFIDVFEKYSMDFTKRTFPFQQNSYWCVEVLMFSKKKQYLITLILKQLIILWTIQSFVQQDITKNELLCSLFIKC